MAKHRAKCPRCGTQFEIDPSAANRVTCPACKAPLRVPISSRPSDPGDPMIGQTIGEFEILALLGAGGMGAVYKARQRGLDRFVAVKVLPNAALSDGDLAVHFEREARAAAAVSHPSIIQIISVGRDRGYSFLAMEYVEGEGLDAVLRREGRLPVPRGLPILRQVASALAAAHEAGIIHRDIKPSNILVDSTGVAKVTDFGLAKRMGIDATMTGGSAAIGTPLYMPPEIGRGQRLDAGSDLYSLGATFYHLLAGRPPFEASGSAELIVKHATADPPPLAQVAPEVGPGLARIIGRLLRKKPEERYASARALLEDLDALDPNGTPSSAGDRAGMSGMSTLSLAPEKKARIERRVRRVLRLRAARPAVIAVGAVGALLALWLILALSNRPASGRAAGTGSRPLTASPASPAAPEGQKATLPSVPAERPADTRPPEPQPPAAPPQMDAHLAEILRTWPIAFQDRLDQPSCLDRALVARGQYSPPLAVKGGALFISGVHTHSAAWWNCPVGDSFALSTDFKKVGEGTPCAWLCGPGYGNSPDLAYTLRLPIEKEQMEVRLWRDGKPLGGPVTKAPAEMGRWYHLDVVKEGDRFTVYVDGEKLAERRDPTPLRGALHRFLAMGALNGFYEPKGIWYRDMAIRMPRDETQRLAAERVERLFDPAPGVPPELNGAPLFNDDFAQGALSRWSVLSDPRAVREKEGGIVLGTTPNASPNVWRKDPLQGSFAVEFDMSYFPQYELLNFQPMLRMGDFLDQKQESFRGWNVGFPYGEGVIALHWRNGPGDGRRLAMTSYLTPVGDRPYVLRIERDGSRLRAFVNGGFLLEATAPEDIPPDTPLHVGMRQFYGGSTIRRVAAWQIPHRPTPAPAAPAPLPGGDFGPGLAASANFFAAFASRVGPLLARRQYSAADAAVGELAGRPEFALAAEQVRLCRKDLARVRSLWARVEKHLAALPAGQAISVAGRQATFAKYQDGQLHYRAGSAEAQAPLTDLGSGDVLALLGPTLPADEECRLSAAIFLILDKDSDTKRALSLLGDLRDNEDARRCSVLALRNARP